MDNFGLLSVSTAQTVSKSPEPFAPITRSPRVNSPLSPSRVNCKRKRCSVGDFVRPPSPPSTRNNSRFGNELPAGGALTPRCNKSRGLSPSKLHRSASRSNRKAEAPLRRCHSEPSKARASWVEPENAHECNNQSPQEENPESDVENQGHEPNFDAEETNVGDETMQELEHTTSTIDEETRATVEHVEFDDDEFAPEIEMPTEQLNTQDTDYSDPVPALDQAEVEAQQPQAAPQPPVESAESVPQSLEDPQPAKQYPEIVGNTVVIFDWDDTLLSSTFLAQLGYRLDLVQEFPPKLQEQLNELEKHVLILLNYCIDTVGAEKTVIITNAERGWVELSAKKFIPGVLPLVEKCHVISARTTFEIENAGPYEWKILAFYQKLQQSFGVRFPPPFIGDRCPYYPVLKEQYDNYVNGVATVSPQSWESSKLPVQPAEEEFNLDDSLEDSFDLENEIASTQEDITFEQSAMSFDDNNTSFMEKSSIERPAPPHMKWVGLPGGGQKLEPVDEENDFIAADGVADSKDKDQDLSPNDDESIAANIKDSEWPESLFVTRDTYMGVIEVFNKNVISGQVYQVPNNWSPFEPDRPSLIPDSTKGSFGLFPSTELKDSESCALLTGSIIISYHDGASMIPTPAMMLVHYQTEYTKVFMADKALTEIIVFDQEGQPRHLVEDEDADIKMVQVGKMGVIDFAEYNNLNNHGKWEWLHTESKNCLEMHDAFWKTNGVDLELIRKHAAALAEKANESQTAPVPRAMLLDEQNSYNDESTASTEANLSESQDSSLAQEEDSYIRENDESGIHGNMPRDQAWQATSEWHLSHSGLEFRAAQNQEEVLKTTKCVLSFGDSLAEKNATKAVTRMLENSVFKTVKFIERPTITEVIRQIDLVLDHMSFFLEGSDPLDVVLALDAPQ